MTSGSARINRTRSLPVSSVKLSVSITRTVILLFTTRWFVWHRTSATGMSSSTVTETSVRSTATPLQPCDIRKPVCQKSQWKLYVISIKTLLILKITTMDQNGNRKCCRPASRTCLSTVRAALQSGWQRISRRTSSVKSSMGFLRYRIIRTSRFLN